MIFKLLAIAMLGLMLFGCRGSIIRNAAEVGIETALEAPDPTPSATVKR